MFLFRTPNGVRMLKVFKKIATKKETDSKPENGELTAQSFAGLGRAKLRQDILKHQGLVGAPSLTPAGLAIKKKKEKENAPSVASKISQEDIYGSPQPSHLSYLSSIGVMSSSIDATPSQIKNLPLSPLMTLEEDDGYVVNHQDSKDKINLPSLSSEANMTFNNDVSFELPTDDEAYSSKISNHLPEMVSLGDVNFDAPTTMPDPLKPLSLSQIKRVEPKKESFFETPDLSDSDTIEFSLSPELQVTPKNTKEESEDEMIASLSSLSASSLSLSDSPALGLQPGITMDLSNEISFANGQEEVSLDISSLPVATPAEPIVLSKGVDLNNKLYGKQLSGQELDFAQGLATAYSEHNSAYVIESLREYLTENNGQVPQKFWYMLMDCYQADNKKEEFEKAAISFAQIFNTSPPSWFETEEVSKQTVMSGKNIMILEPHFKMAQTEKFPAFLKAAKSEKFCRINVSPCKFELSEVGAVLKLLELFKTLRKAKVLAVLMGDNNLINFCKNYIKPDYNNKMLKEEFLAEEANIWLLYLEVLQWKGMKEEFEDLALEYAVTFEISPPDWDDNGVMRLDKSHKVEIEDDEPELDKVINGGNVSVLLDMIEKQFASSKKPEINLSFVEAIDFAAAGSISFKIQEIWMEPANQNKKIVFIHPNEMIVTLFDMVGVTEFVEILPRKR